MILYIDYMREMKRKLKVLFRCFLIILVTIACVFAGLNTRHKKAIIVTQFGQTQPVSKAGYLIESEENRLVMIDGGNSADIVNTIKNKGGIVEAWFITLPHKESAETILNVLKSNEIQVNGIYVSLYGKDWYEENESKEEFEFISDFIDLLESDNVRDRVHELQLRDEINIDNLNFKALKVKNPDYTQNIANNQSMVIKVSNNFKSMIFLGSLGSEYQQDFVNHNQDEIKCDSVQVSYHGEITKNEEIYKSMKAKKYFYNTSEDVGFIDVGAENYISNYEDITVEI